MGSEQILDIVEIKLMVCKIKLMISILFNRLEMLETVIDMVVPTVYVDNI